MIKALIRSYFFHLNNPHFTFPADCGYYDPYPTPLSLTSYPISPSPSLHSPLKKKPCFQNPLPFHQLLTFFTVPKPPQTRYLTAAFIEPERMKVLTILEDTYLVCLLFERRCILYINCFSLFEGVDDMGFFGCGAVGLFFFREKENIFEGKRWG